MQMNHVGSVCFFGLVLFSWLWLFDRGLGLDPMRHWPAVHGANESQTAIDPARAGALGLSTFCLGYSRPCPMRPSWHCLRPMLIPAAVRTERLGYEVESNAGLLPLALAWLGGIATGLKTHHKRLGSLDTHGR